MVFEGDTLIAITSEQLVKINLAIASERQYKAEAEVLAKSLHNADSVSNYWRQITVLQDSLIFATREKFERAEELNKEFDYLLKKQKKENLRTTIGVGVGGILLGTLTGLLLVK